MLRYTFLLFVRSDINRSLPRRTVYEWINSDILQRTILSCSSLMHLIMLATANRLRINLTGSWSMELYWNLKMNAKLLHFAQTSSCTWYVICPDKFLLLMRKLHFWSSMNHFLRLTTLDLPAVSLSRYSWSFSHNRQWAWLKSSLELSTLYSDFQLRYSEYRSSFSSNFTGWKIQESLIKQQKMWFKDIYLDIARGLPCCGSPSC